MDILRIFHVVFETHKTITRDNGNTVEIIGAAGSKTQWY
jgi:hypothetical protein